MKYILILSLIVTNAHAQSYVSMSAQVNNVHPFHASASFGHRFTNNVVAEGSMHVPLSLRTADAAYFMLNAGYSFNVNEELSLYPVAGFGYALRTTDKSDAYLHLNRIAWRAGGRITSRWFMGEVYVMDKQLYATVGVIGWFTR